LRQIHAHNYLHVNSLTARDAGIADGDWIWVESQWGKVRCMARYSESVEPGTVWTWNAIGKAAGAWNLSPDAKRIAKKVFCLITLSPRNCLRCRMASVTPTPIRSPDRQAWYDVRVRIYKAEEGEPEQTSPQFEPLQRYPGMNEPPRWLAYFGRQEKRRWENDPIRPY